MWITIAYHCCLPCQGNSIIATVNDYDDYDDYDHDNEKREWTRISAFKMRSVSCVIFDGFEFSWWLIDFAWFCDSFCCSHDKIFLEREFIWNVIFFLLRQNLFLFHFTQHFVLVICKTKMFMCIW